MRLDDVPPPLLVIDARNMDVDVALAPLAGTRRPRSLERHEAAVRIALHGEDRMHGELHVEAAVGDHAHDRIDQERHVVVDDLEHRHGLEPLVRRAGAGRGEAHARRCRACAGEQRPGVRRQRGKLAGVVAHEVFRHRAREHRGDEIGRNVRVLGSQDLAGGRDQGLRGAFFIAWRMGLGGHALSLAPSGGRFRDALGAEFFPIPRVSARANWSGIPIRAIPLHNQSG